MNVQQVERDNIIERFLSGKLSDQEEAEFEEFLFEHPEYLDEVQWARDLGRTLRSVASRKSAQQQTARQISFVAWLAGRGRAQQRALLAAMLAIVLLPSAFLVLQWQGPSAAPNAPQGNTPLIFLGASRGAAPSEGQAIALGSEPHWIVLQMDLPVPQQAVYRADLLDSQGRILWQFEDLAPTMQETLTVSLHSNFLEPGHYSLRIEGLSDGQAKRIGEFPFRIVVQD